jgi:hypothetical protein
MLRDGSNSVQILALGRAAGRITVAAIGRVRGAPRYAEAPGVAAGHVFVRARPDQLAGATKRAPGVHALGEGAATGPARCCGTDPEQSLGC